MSKRTRCFIRTRSRCIFFWGVKNKPIRCAESVTTHSSLFCINECCLIRHEIIVNGVALRAWYMLQRYSCHWDWMRRFLTFFVNWHDLYFWFCRIILPWARILIHNFYWILLCSGSKGVFVMLCNVGAQLHIRMHTRTIIAWTWQLRFEGREVEFVCRDYAIGRWE